MSEIFLNGPAGRIEGLYTESPNKNAPVALVLHPHPLHGGTMNNKVVYSLYKTLAERGFTVLRINFRGVGKSQGIFDNGIGELTDAATALDWLSLNHGFASSTLIAGFSFGAWIALQMIMRRPEIDNFIAVSPPVNKYDFSFLAPCPIPGVIVQGNQDNIVQEESVSDLAYRLSRQKLAKVSYKVIDGADHFFRGKLDLLSEEVGYYIRDCIQGNNLVNDFTENNCTEEKGVKKFQTAFLD